LRFDVVLIVLKDDINIDPLELHHGEVETSDISLVHASYPADRRYVLSGHFGCHLLAQDGTLWATDCDTHEGSSGGPVFIQGKDGLKLVAIMVGIKKGSKGYPASIAVPTLDWVDVAAKRKCP
jgi:V8-like Glu-specific endopeptidase